ncbi:signal peptidase I [Rossellomorea vietnamensis]|uniref:Signal peptidase I n=1 Tax=Rossellomorea vietnamensis TaxID=218284 RepID=A0A5D4NYV5_9BACI|nr:signal peptidase I [Rossellomorea vietnamensis]TYS17862.1 signal peptidase I [Rossellomorea vietnamensis]
MNGKKLMKWGSNIVTTILFLVLIFMVFVVVSSKASGGEPQVFGHQLKTVLSGSMEPGIKTGSIIAVKPGGDMSRFEKGDVITFQKEKDMLVTHRVTEVIKSGDNIMYKTKGDNNNAEDMNPVLSENVVAEYSGFTIPYLGYFMNFTNSKNGAFLLLVPGILLLIYSGFTIWKAISEIEIKTKKNDTIENNAS